VGNAEECVETVTRGPCPLRIDAEALSCEISIPSYSGWGRFRPIHRTHVRVEVPGCRAGDGNDDVPNPDMACVAVDA
jgi:hypothetical protein